MKYKITTITENKPGVLYRIADLFLRRRINIDSLSVREIDTAAHLSQFNIEVDCDKDIVPKIVNQIRRIIEVVEIEAFAVERIHRH